MSERNLVHPSTEDWHAYNLGKMNAEALAEMERHLAVCDLCRQAVQTLPDGLPAAEKAGSEANASTSVLGHLGLGTREVTAAFTPSGAVSGSGLPLAVAIDLEVPADLTAHPRYHVLELLGIGGMGTVYKAEHQLMTRLVALKVINSDLVSRPGMVERFRREVRAAACLSHPNIVTAYDAEQAGMTHFLVMEFVAGTSLDRVIARQGRLDVRRACDYARQVCTGLQHAHECGMVHRDIKPHNLMLTPQGQVKILDFGLARLLAESGQAEGYGGAGVGHEVAGRSDAGEVLVTEASSVVGTMDYLAPEQARDAHNADVRADIYSLGCTLYHLLAGVPPFPRGEAVDKLRAHAYDLPEPLHRLRKDVPRRLARVVERMMAKDPARRYQTPAEAAKALEPFANPEAAPRRLHQFARALAVVTLLTLLAFWGYWSGPDFYRFATNQGQLVVDPGSRDVKVVVKQEGKPVQVIHANAKTGRVNLKAGTYDLELAEGGEKLQLSATKINLLWGDLKTITVLPRPSGPFRDRPRDWRWPRHPGQDKEPPSSDFH